MRRRNPPTIGYQNNGPRRKGSTNEFKFLKLTTTAAIACLIAGVVLLNLSVLRSRQQQQTRQNQAVGEGSSRPVPSDTQQDLLTNRKKAKEVAAKDDEYRYHIVFSTSCAVRDWQSYLFFYMAMEVGQEGEVTQIMSGCNKKQEQELREFHRTHYAEAMNPNFFVHFTPDYSIASDFQVTKYWNKPFGLKSWMEQRFGFLEKQEIESSNEYNNDIVILIDPDMLMIKPFRNDFSSQPESLWNRYARRTPDRLFHHVRRGRVMAQEYAFGDRWLQPLLENNLTYVIGTDDSPVQRVDLNRAAGAYAGGPPYLATAPDFYRIACKWAEYLPRYYEVRPHMLNEMYSYSLAVAHLGFEHQMAKGFMVSDVDLLEKEGWGFLTGDGDEEMLRNACSASKHSTHSLPQVIHFCQRYGIGEWFISKYKVPRRTFTCGFPLYEQPPADIAETAMYAHLGDFSREEFKNNSQHSRKRAANAFMVCSIYRALNEASKFYKDHHCAPEEANYNATWQYFKVYDRDPHGPGMGEKSRSK